MELRNKVKLPILGIDLHSGSPNSAKGCKYSVVVIKDGDITLEKRGVPREELLKMAAELGPCILATDNVFELAPDVSGLRRLLKKLPSGSKILQVNKEGPWSEKLTLVARKEGLLVRRNADSLTEARIIAILASKGMGSEVILFEPECRVIVARNASVKKGGSGTNRWRRMIEAAILNETNRIASSLEEEGLEFDLYVNQAEGGLRRAEFVVYAPESRVREIVKPTEGEFIKVTITRRMKKKLEFSDQEEEDSSRPIMVSIDPGTSLGLAVLDLEGDLLALKTLRMPSKSQIIEEIVKYGRPILITTDVFPIPERVKEIAKVFNARVEAAADLLTLKEKEKIVQEFEDSSDIRASTSHERDALAALLITYKRLVPLFKKAEAKAKEKGLPFTLKVKELLIKGKSISEALQLATKPKVLERRKVRKPKKRKPVNVGELMRRIKELEDRVSFYEDLLKQKEREILELMERISQLKERINLEVERDRRVIQRDERIKELMQELRKERQRNELLLSRIKELERALKEPPAGWVQVSVLKKISKEIIEQEASEERIREGDVLVVIDSSGMGRSTVNLLSELGVQALIWKRNPPPPEVVQELERRGISVICGKDVDIWWRGGIPYVKGEVLLRTTEFDRISRGGRIDIKEVIREYRSRILREEEVEE